MPKKDNAKIPTPAVQTDPQGMGERSYRQLVQTRLTPVRVVIQETDLSIYADRDVQTVSKEAVIEQRGYIENYIRRHPEFPTCLTPWPTDPMAPEIVRHMIDAGQKARVGPMASVAGAVAEHVGRCLISEALEIIIENGGDLYLNVAHELTIAVYAATSPLSLKVGLKISATQMPIAVCTSSGTVGHSRSEGCADAVCVVSLSGPLADAAATAIGNRVSVATDIDSAIRWGKSIEGVLGILIIFEKEMGVWGQIELVPLDIA
jgi:ApbE superfamily uncharacterized protein (UPF0280 family)